MNKTRIEWCDYTINPVKGLCPMACPYCYARRIYKRFKWNLEIIYKPNWWWDLVEIEKKEKPARIFMGSTIELFGDWIKPEWMEEIFQIIRDYENHTFIFLTKQPQNLIKWSPFPDNCWVGVSVTTRVQFLPAIYGLTDVQCNKRFLSIEPMLENVLPQVLPAEWDDAIDWLILGSRTQPVKHPPREWVDEIIDACDEVKIPVFIKDPLATHYNIQRKESPRNSSIKLTINDSTKLIINDIQ